MIQVAVAYAARPRVRFIGIDEFESRPASAAPLSLKSAYQLLSPLGARVQLLPGDPLAALSRSANTLLGTDLMVVAADQDLASLAHAWFYVPRMLHDRSLVLVETAGRDGGESSYRLVNAVAIRQLALQAQPRRRAA